MNENLNGWAISTELFKWIRENFTKGSTILELGSGTGTIDLCKHYTMYSVEHNPRFVGLAASNYIYAPIKDGWYDTEVLKKMLPDRYDLIIVDGPPRRIGRQGFFDNLSLFRHDVPIVFDDTQRPEEYALAIKTAAFLNMKVTQMFSTDKSFIILAP